MLPAAKNLVVTNSS